LSLVTLATAARGTNGDIIHHMLNPHVLSYLNGGVTVASFVGDVIHHAFIYTTTDEMDATYVHDNILQTLVSCAPARPASA
jgi:hypothetical protein